MNPENQRPTPGILDRATEALRATLPSQGPPQRVIESTIDLLRSHTHLPDSIRIQDRRQRMFRIARNSGLAVALLLLVGASVTWFVNNNAAPAFAQVIENVKKATSVSFRSSFELANESTTKASYYFQGDLVRMEIEESQQRNAVATPNRFSRVSVGNMRTRDALEIDYHEHTALKSHDAEHLQFPGDFVAAFRALTEKDAKLVGDEVLDGKKTRVYHLEKLDLPVGIAGEESQPANIWINPESGLPVKIQTMWPLTAPIVAVVTMENFKWDEPINPKLFSMDVPEGFTVTESKSSQPEPAK